MNKKFLIAVMLALNSFGCASYQLSPTASDTEFNTVVGHDASKVRMLVRDATYLKIVGLPQAKRGKFVANLKVLANDIKDVTNTASSKIDTQVIVDLVTKNLNNKNPEDKATLQLVIDGIGIYVDDQVSLSIPDTILNNRKFLATKQFLLSAADGILDATTLD